MEWRSLVACLKEEAGSQGRGSGEQDSGGEEDEAAQGRGPEAGGEDQLGEGTERLGMADVALLL